MLDLPRGINKKYQIKTLYCDLNFSILHRYIPLTLLHILPTISVINCFQGLIFNIGVANDPKPQLASSNMSDN